MLTNKQRLQMLLQDQVPDIPPHFELVFQIEREMFGMDWQKAKESSYASAAARRDAIEKFNIELCSRLVDELSWAAVPALCYGYDEGMDSISDKSRPMNPLEIDDVGWKYDTKGQVFVGRPITVWSNT